MAIIPALLYSIFKDQPIHSLRLDGDRAHIKTDAGITTLNLADVEMDQGQEWGGFLRKITLRAGGVAYPFGGLWPGRASKVAAAVVEAKRRRSLRTSLDTNWDAYEKCYAGWLALTRPDSYIPEEALSKWVATLPPHLPTARDADIVGLLPQDRQAILRKVTVIAANPKQAASCHDALLVLQSWRLLTMDRYVPNSNLETWLSSVPTLQLPAERDSDILQSLSPDQQEAIDDTRKILAQPREYLDMANTQFVQGELVRFRELFDHIEKYPLTERQREAAVSDEDNCLVVAGAGTGKTSTIVARVVYLVKKGLAAPDEVLLLAFTNKAADEMRERLGQDLADVKVCTFHALGLEIVGQADGREPALSGAARDDQTGRNLFRDIAAELMKRPLFMERYLKFLALLGKAYRSAWEFKSEREYRQYLFAVEPRALAGCLVRSYEECEIANWLTLHGIRFEYERPYEVNVATAEHRQYKPDFFLPDHHLYIEHWGVDRAGLPPPYVDGDRYRARMQWARNLHQGNGTVLVETYSWERQEGTLLTNLERKLSEHGVPIGWRSVDDALATLNAAGVVDPFAELVGTFIALFKSGEHNLDALRKKASSHEHKERAGLFVDLFADIFAEYQRRLSDRQEIDFEDMIVRAAEHVREGRFASPFRHILVDEFQDIAQGRASLIKALREQVPGGRLFCVGDDWQSIYRFTGSDIGLMTHFKERFGYTKQILLDRTFRFDKRLASFSSRFILKNPSQLSKTLSARESVNGPPVVVKLRQEETDPLPTVLEEIRSAGGQSVLVLNRYNFQFTQEYQADLARLVPEVDIRFHTVHSAKGLEADYVILDNLRSGRYGFPTEITDDPILGLVLAEPDRHPHGEERRLFYVGLTRARQRVFLVADAEKVSCFVEEILDDDEQKKEVRADGPVLAAKCPCCEKGRLTLRDGPHGVFYGCSLFPLCEYTEEACPVCRRGLMRKQSDAVTRCGACGHEARTCPKCGQGYLVMRTRHHDGRRFWGCSTWRPVGAPCTYTEDVG